MESFSEISESVFRDYIRSAVIIDDHWPEHEIVIGDEQADESELVAEEDDLEVATTGHGDGSMASPRSSTVDEMDAEILARLRHALIREGVLACGLRYQRRHRDVAVKLARCADIVVLDWNLSSDNGEEALEILKELQGDSLRFVCIWTGQDRARQVREMVIGNLSHRSQESELVDDERQGADLRCGNLVIAIRVKEGLEADPELAVGPDQFLEVAINGLCRRFGGLVQLAMLELTHRHREQLPEILEHIGSSIDSAVLFEAGDEKSPVGPGAVFLGILVDEWRSRLEQDVRPVRSLSASGRRAFGRRLLGARNEQWSVRLIELLESIGAKPQIARRCCDSISPVLESWLKEGCEGEFPAVQGFSPKVAAWASLFALTMGDRVLEPLLQLETLLHQQFNRAKSLTQGTVVRAKDGASEMYLICITPLCDADRPEKIGGLYTFVRTQVVSTTEVIQGCGAQSYCVIKHDGEYLCLAMLFKERVSLEIAQAAFRRADGFIEARLSLGGRKVSGARKSRIMSIVA
jgi:hypothetical protein